MRFKQSDESSERPKREQLVRRLVKTGGMLLAALLIFGFGLGVGNGYLSFDRGGSGPNAHLPGKLDYTTVSQVYQILKSDYDGTLSQQQLLDGLKTGLAQSTGDPYTEYFNPQQAKEFNSQLDGAFTGVGAELGQDAAGNLIVIAPLDGSPAAKAGLRAKDVIASIDGQSTSGMSVDVAVNKIRGKKGTQVTLKVVRDKAQQLSFTITRQDIKVPSVKWQILDGNIGYLQISQFSDDTSDLAQQAALEFKQKNVKGVVLDLRDNPGGLLDAAVNVSSLWVPAGKTILQEKHDGIVTNTYHASNNNILQGVPTAVLINSGSASAAEITAGALHDNNVAALYGEQSFGKGVVQEVRNLPAGAELKVTVARWYRPNGQNIDKKGIVPDHAVQMTDDDYKQAKDPQKDAALASLLQ